MLSRRVVITSRFPWKLFSTASTLVLLLAGASSTMLSQASQVKASQSHGGHLVLTQNPYGFDMPDPYDYHLFTSYGVRASVNEAAAFLSQIPGSCSAACETEIGILNASVNAWISADTNHTRTDDFDRDTNIHLTKASYRLLKAIKADTSLYAASLPRNRRSLNRPRFLGVDALSDCKDNCDDDAEKGYVGCGVIGAFGVWPGVGCAIAVYFNHRGCVQGCKNKNHGGQC